MLNFILMLFFALLRATVGLTVLLFSCSVMTFTLIALFGLTFVGAWLAGVTVLSVHCYRRLTA